MTHQKFNLSKLAKAILDKRTKDNLTFRGIAKTTKNALPHSTLHRIEDQAAVPSATVLGAICNWLGQPVSNFF
jgi:hypothetical protein